MAAVAVCQMELPLSGLSRQVADVSNAFLEKQRPTSARSSASGNGDFEQLKQISRSKSRTKSRTKDQDQGQGPMPEIADRSRLGGKIARPAALDLGFKKEGFRSFRPLSAGTLGSPNSPGSQPQSPWSSASNWSPWQGGGASMRVTFHVGDGDDGDSSPGTPKLDSQDLLTRSVGFSLKKTHSSVGFSLTDSAGSLPAKGGEEPSSPLSRVNSLPCLEGQRKRRPASRSLLSLVEDSELEKAGVLATKQPRLKGLAKRMMMIRKVAG